MSAHNRRNRASRRLRGQRTSAPLDWLGGPCLVRPTSTAPSGPENHRGQPAPSLTVLAGGEPSDVTDLADVVDERVAHDADHPDSDEPADDPVTVLAAYARQIEDLAASVESMAAEEHNRWRVERKEQRRTHYRRVQALADVGAAATDEESAGHAAQVRALHTRYHRRFARLQNLAAALAECHHELAGTAQRWLRDGPPASISAPRDNRTLRDLLGSP
jgi:hypothetical protein